MDDGETQHNLVLLGVALSVAEGFRYLNPTYNLIFIWGCGALLSSYQLSIINYQLSIINYQLSIVNCLNSLIATPVPTSAAR